MTIHYCRNKRNLSVEERYATLNAYYAHRIAIGFSSLGNACIGEYYFLCELLGKPNVFKHCGQDFNANREAFEEYKRDMTPNDATDYALWRINMNTKESKI